MVTLAQLALEEPNFSSRASINKPIVARYARLELSGVLVGFLPREHLRHRSCPVSELSMRVH